MKINTSCLTQILNSKIITQHAKSNRVKIIKLINY